jgi:hypothetical protein
MEWTDRVDISIYSRNSRPAGKRGKHRGRTG